VQGGSVGSSARQEGSVGVLAKAAAVLDCLCLSEREMTSAQVAQRLGEPRPTIYRLLGNLQDLGFVEPGERRGTYRLGLKLLRLGTSVTARLSERQAAEPVMERISEQTGETVFLCVRRGNRAVCIERKEGARVAVLALQLGGSLPLHVGAAPRTLLAFEPQESWENYLANADLESFTPNTPLSAEDVTRELQKVRDTGLSISDEDVTIGIAAVGAPIFDYRGNMCAALSVAGMRSQILGEGSEASRLIIEGASEISRELGYEKDVSEEEEVV
jgi:DNA-binding IclR family transcriptional regulator